MKPDMSQYDGYEIIAYVRPNMGVSKFSWSATKFTAPKKSTMKRGEARSYEEAEQAARMWLSE
jgi:hypothetical protein